jgi:hypothetical protein
VTPRCWALVAVAAGACSSGPAAPSREARRELATFLRTMDHELDLFWDRYAGHLALRPDLPSTAVSETHIEVSETHIEVAIAPSELRVDGVPIGAAALGERLAAARAQIEADLARRYTPDRELAGLRERIWIVVDPAAAWRTVTEVVTTAAAAGFVEPLFVVARPPATPPPPRSAIDDGFDAARARGGQAAMAYLSAARDRLLAACPDLQAALAVDTGASDVAGGALERFAAAIETTSCRFDLAQVRSFVWCTAGNPYPHAVVAMRVTRDGAPLAMPGATAWRDAAAKIVPATEPVRFVATP